MKIWAIFIAIIFGFVFGYSDIDACIKCKPKQHNHHIAGKSHSKPRSKDTTSKEIRKKPQKPQRSHEKKRDRYGVSCINESNDLMVLNP